MRFVGYLIEYFFDFSYPISRSHPYRWFRWATTLGGLCFLVLFTAINLATNGYQLDLQRTRNLNATMSQKRWTDTFPFSILDHTSISCQTPDLSLNTEFWTDKLGLTYTLVSAWQNSTNSTVYSVSIPYSNNTLEDCNVWYVQINLDAFDNAGTQLIAPWDVNAIPQGIGKLSWSPRATALVNCTLHTSDNPTYITLAAEYAKLVAPGKMSPFPSYPARTNLSSLWWGESLLSWYWSNLSISYFDDNDRGAANLIPRDGLKPITAFDFFHVSGYWFKGPNSGATTWNANDPSGIPQAGFAIDSFAKAMYATVLADLGQNSSHPYSNALLHSNLLANLSAPINGLANTPWGPGEWIQAGPANSSFSPSTKDKLGITHSQIYMDYLCQVPVLKPWASLFIVVLVADLVLMQTTWILLNLFTSLWHFRKDPYANYCEGCIKLTEGNFGMIGLDKVPSKPYSSTRGSRSSIDLPLIETGRAQATARSDDAWEQDGSHGLGLSGPLTTPKMTR